MSSNLNLGSNKMTGTDDMTNAHRQLLQAFMSRGIMDAKEVRNQFRYACERNNRKHSHIFRKY